MDGDDGTRTMKDSEWRIVHPTDEGEHLFGEWITVHDDLYVSLSGNKATAEVPHGSRHGGYIIAHSAKVHGGNGGVVSWVMQREKGSGNIGIARHPINQNQYIWSGGILQQDYSTLPGRFVVELDLDRRVVEVGSFTLNLPKPPKHGEEYLSLVVGMHHGGIISCICMSRPLWRPERNIHAQYPRAFRTEVEVLLCIHSKGCSEMMNLLPTELVMMIISMLSLSYRNTADLGM